jgi:hypothetical protein
MKWRAAGGRSARSRRGLRGARMKAFVMKEIGRVGFMDKPVPYCCDLMTTHTFGFDDMERAFEVSDQKLDDVIKPLITF